MKGFSTALPIALLSCHALAAQIPQPVSPPPPASLSEPQSTAAYQFALAKLLSVEGSLPEAYTVDVRFKLPLRLPARAAFSYAGGAFAVHDARTGKPHLDGWISAPDGALDP